VFGFLVYFLCRRALSFSISKLLFIKKGLSLVGFFLLLSLYIFFRGLGVGCTFLVNPVIKKCWSLYKDLFGFYWLYTKKQH
jgi:hypothetical protein